MSTRKQTAIRLSDEEKRAIEERAQAHGLTLSDYMRRCALGELADRSSLEERVAALEAAMYGNLSSSPFRRP